MKRALTVLALLHPWGAAAQNLPETVRFKSLDGQTELVGYLFSPRHRSTRQIAAVVMMHGRAGPYSSAAHGRFDASTLSRRHQFWGDYWADRGYEALLVDGFGPRGYAEGFPIHSYTSRPEALNEVTVRPLDAYGALLYLRTRTEIDPRRVVLQGWSNGGSATIAALSDGVFATPQIAGAGLSASNGFLGAIAFYPACTLHDRFTTGYRPYAPLRLLSGDADEEVSTTRCAALTEASQRKGGDMAITIYPGATHGFDDPNGKRQKVEANARATHDAISRATDFVRDVFNSVNSHAKARSGAEAEPLESRKHTDSTDH
jgi:carboxymethylenebutenolidase